MKYIQREVKEDFTYLVPMSDLHIGDKHFNERKAKEYVDWVKTHQNARIWLNGDILNVATRSSASSPFEQNMDLSEQIDKAVSIFAPVKDKILGAISGNHENRIEEICGYNPMRHVCQQLGVPYLGLSAVLALRVGKGNGVRKGKPSGDFITYVLYFHHTTGGGSTPGSKVNRVEKMRGIITNADAYIGSHSHQLFAVPELGQHYSGAKRGIVQQRQFLIGTGSFLDWDNGYAERMQLQPAKLGCPRIRLSSNKKDIHVSI